MMEQEVVNNDKIKLKAHMALEVAWTVNHWLGKFMDPRDNNFQTNKIANDVPTSKTQ